jgi:thiol-disulfide isomerase/thioredoxin
MVHTERSFYFSKKCVDMTTKKLWLAVVAGTTLGIPKELRAYEAMNFISGDIRAAQILAAKEGKLVFVDFRANWCAPCKIMEEYTFTHPSVETAIQSNYVPVQVDIDEIDGFELKQKFNVKVLPTMLIFNSQGKLIGKYEESMAASRLIDVLETHNLTDNKVKTEALADEFSPAPPKIKPTPAPTPKVSVETPVPNTAEVDPGGEEGVPAKPEKTPAAGLGGQNMVMPASGFTIQTGVYAQLSFVKKEVERIKGRLGDLQRIFVYGNKLPNGTQVFKVLVGAFNNKAEAQCYLRVTSAKGIPGLVKSFPELRQQ